MPWQCKCRYPGSLGGDCDGSCQSPPPPEIWKDCEVCGGEGQIYKAAFVYEAGCGFGHDDVHSVECDACAGNGGFICDAEGDPAPRQSNINECPSCRRMFVDGETCPRGGCPMGGDF